MSTDHPPPTTPHVPRPSSARSPARMASVAVLLLVGALELAPGSALAAPPPAKVVRPLVNPAANATRKALLQQRSSLLSLPVRHPGKTVGGANAPVPKTIVTKRFLPK